MDAIAILVGWPSLGVAFLLSIAGVWLKKSYLVWIGVILILPMTLYLSAAPAFPFVALVPAAALVVAALTCRRSMRWQPWTGIGIYAAFLFAFAWIVIHQPAY